jgi:SAM-dependent methyltransferase
MPDQRLLDDIRGRQWTGHNIALADGVFTIGGDIPPISADERTLTIKSLIRSQFPSSRPLRIADLGALEGGLSLELAREGWDVTGIEGRQANFEKAELIRNYFALPNLRFELRDVKTLDAARDGVFDVIVCCGLLYHLDDPFSFLETLARLTARDGLLFLDTHVAPEGATKVAQVGEPTTFAHGARTYDGRWVVEPREGNVLDQHWSAVSNDRSFWPTRRSLIRGVYHAGFHAVMELFGMWEIDREFALRDEFSRLYLACRREW